MKEELFDLSEKKSPFSKSLILKKGLWLIVSKVFFRTTNRKLFGVRRALLVLFGAKLGSRSFVYPTTNITMPWNLKMGDNCVLGPNVTCYNTALIQIGNNTTISQGTHLCSATHDFKSSDFKLYAKPIIIGDSVWIAAEAFIGPGVRVQSNTVVGARAVVSKDIGPDALYAGNPAREIRKL